MRRCSAHRAILKVTARLWRRRDALRNCAVNSIRKEGYLVSSKNKFHPHFARKVGIISRLVCYDRVLNVHVKRYN